jgi:hypothetical protein
MSALNPSPGVYYGCIVFQGGYRDRIFFQPEAGEKINDKRESTGSGGDRCPARSEALDCSHDG